MNVRKITMTDFQAAFAEMNLRYDGNIEPLYIVTDGSGFAFRLQAKDNRGPGSKASASWARTKAGERRRTKAACWHAHGYLFEAILDRSPDSYITTGFADGRIDIDGGNWQDRNVGAPIQPVLMSDLCECKEREIA